jgi:hypothetical protein
MTAPVDTSRRSDGRILTIISFVMGVIALLFVPIIVGPVGAVLGFVGNARGDKPMGMWAGIWCIAATIIGLVLAAVVINSKN